MLKEIKFYEVKDSTRFADGVKREELYRDALDAALKRISRNLKVFIGKYPHVGRDNIYVPEENKLWTASFFPGMVYLAYDITGDGTFLKYSEEYLKSFEWRLKEGHTATHDLGFLYTLSCVSLFKLTGNRKAKELALRAADKLAERYSEKGRYIQAWGAIGLNYPDVKIIIDTMLNLPLLYWAAKITGNGRYYDIAVNHAFTASQYLVRDDASTFHTYLMEPDTGKAVAGKTHQGRNDGSTWARGQAWAVYGFVLSYSYTREPYFLDAAIKTANIFLNNLPKDFIPYWDFSFDDRNPDIRDSSAAAIFLCGLLEIARHTATDNDDLYKKAAFKIIESLVKNYSIGCESESNGLLLHGMYHRNDGADECTIWGDYYYVEALVRLLKDWKPYW